MLRQTSRALLLVFTSVILAATFQNCAPQFKLSTAPSFDDLSNAASALPTITFSQSPAVINANQLNLNFSVSSPNGVTISSVMCQVNNQTPQDCSTGALSLNNLLDGDYSVKVMGTTSAGVSFEQIKTFRKDSTIPSLMVSQAPASLTASQTATFAFSATDNLSGIELVQCSLDGAEYSACISPMNFSALAVGAHTVKIRARDLAQNISQEYSYSWIIDLQVPSVLLSQGPPAFTSSTSAQISFTGVNSVSYECQLGNAASTACVSPYSANNLVEGAQILRVRGKSAAGNLGTAIEVKWTVDVTPPNLPTLTPNVTAISKTKSASINLMATDALSTIASYECSLNNAAFSTCTSPLSLTNLSEGAHGLRVRAKDSAGNTSSNALFNWNVDSVLPVVSISEGPVNPNLSLSASISFVVSDPVPSSGIKVECSINGSAFSICTSPLQYSNLSINIYQVIVRATDNAGNLMTANHMWNAIDVEGGKVLYANNCATCHGVLAASTLNGREITAAKILGGINNISAMAGLKGVLNTAQIQSIEKVFSASPPTTNPTVSSFACAGGEEEKRTSVDLIRLSGTELKNTYQALVPATVWTNMANNFNLLPSDAFVDQISTTLANFSQLHVSKVSEFNEILASQLTANNTQIAAFFGTCATSASFTQACFNTFMNSKASRIFRSALASDDLTTTWAQVSMGTTAIEQQKILVQILFNDPRFLYHLEQGEGVADANGLYNLTSYEIANRISYGMLESPPDATLWAAAVANSLRSSTAVSAQVDRLAATPGFQTRVVQFMKFLIGKSSTNPPDSSAFLNGLNATNLGSALEAEYEDYVRYIIFNRRGNLAELFTSNFAFPKSTAVASIFGTGVATATAPVTATQHVGLITRPFFTLATSPNVKSIQRGRAIRMNLLCVPIPQPTAADLAARPVLTEEDIVGLSSRNYINKATLSAPSCITCHSKMNELGFTLGNYDSVGRFMSIEGIYNSVGAKVASHPVVATTKPAIIETDATQFNSALDFQDALYKSDSLQKCLTTRSYEYFARQPANVTVDSCRLNKLDNVIKQGQPLYNFFIENFKQPSMLYRRSQ